jgi:hypothetical protein
VTFLLLAIRWTLTPASRFCQSGGLPEVLLFLVSIAEAMPNLDQSLAQKFATVVVDCLTSSKSETRAAATTLLEATIVNGVVTVENLRKASERLKPASQRTVAPLLSKFVKQVPDASAEHRQLLSEEPEKASVEARSGKDAVRSVRVVSQASGQGARIPIVAASLEAPSKLSHRTVSHPLAMRAGALQPSSKGIVWPEYPEEPQGASIFGNLKKSWSHMVTPKSMSLLFPVAGIHKQDDANDGCSLLLSALAADRESGTFLVRDQLEFVIRWLTFALCSRETTVGLQAILTLTKDLFLYVRQLRHEMSDSITLEIVPYLFEKASNAKVRSGT